MGDVRRARVVHQRVRVGRAMSFHRGLRKFRALTVRSAQPHECALCGRTIPPQEEHKFDSSGAMQDPTSKGRRMHAECPREASGAAS